MENVLKTQDYINVRYELLLLNTACGMIQKCDLTLATFCLAAICIFIFVVMSSCCSVIYLLT